MESKVHHERRKDFFQGGAEGDFPKIFFKGAKAVKFVFYPWKFKKQPFFANNFKFQGRPCPPFPTPIKCIICFDFKVTNIVFL